MVPETSGLFSHGSSPQKLRRRLKKSRGRNLCALAFVLLALLYMAFTLCAVAMIPALSQQRRSLRGQEDITEAPAIHDLQKLFPVHTNAEREEIDHPGISFAGRDRLKALLPDFDFPDKMSVPTFWNPSEYGERGVRSFLGKHGHRLMTPAEMQNVSRRWNPFSHEPNIPKEYEWL
jgi:hypothetical protein